MEFTRAAEDCQKRERMAVGGRGEGREGRRGEEGEKQRKKVCWRGGSFSHPIFCLHVARGSSPRTPGSGGRYTAAPLHPPRVRGTPPIPQSRLTHPCERWHVPLFHRLLPRAHGVCRLPKTPPPALSFGEGANWLRCAPPVDLPPLDSEADGGLSLFGLLFLVFE